MGVWVCNKHKDSRLDVGSEVVVVECQILDNGKMSFKENCQSCVVAMEARVRGLNVCALGYIDSGVQKALSNNIRYIYKENNELNKAYKEFTSHETLRRVEKQSTYNRKVFVKDNKIQLGELKELANEPKNIKEKFMTLCKKRGYDYRDIINQSKKSYRD